jgi:hypothetical protein
MITFLIVAGWIIGICAALGIGFAIIAALMNLVDSGF